MFLKVLADIGVGDFGLDGCCFEDLRVPDAGELEELGGLDAACAEDDFAGDADCVFLAFVVKSYACCAPLVVLVSPFQYDFLHCCLCEQDQVFSVGGGQVVSPCRVAPFLSLGVYSGQRRPAAKVGSREMTAVGLDSELVERGMPMLAAGGIVGAVDGVQGPVCAVTFLVKESLMAFLVCLVGDLEGFAFLEVWSGR